MLEGLGGLGAIGEHLVRGHRDRTNFLAMADLKNRMDCLSGVSKSRSGAASAVPTAFTDWAVGNLGGGADLQLARQAQLQHAT